MTRVASALRGFAAFWWDFVVGDDWRIAAAVVAALGVTFALARSTTSVWWVLPVVVPAILALSLWDSTRDRGRD